MLGTAAVIGFKLLGFGKKIGKFVTSNWKWIVPLALVVAAYFYVNHEIDKAYDVGYAAGIVHEQKQEQTRIQKENERNRNFETRLVKVVTEFGREVARETAERTVKEGEIRERINTIIRDNPVYEQCVVDPEVIEARNKIRALGPVRIDLDEVKK